MQNFNDSHRSDQYAVRKGKLNVKIFTGRPEDVEKKLKELIKSEPMFIEKVLQSESALKSCDVQTTLVTLTIFYYTQDPAEFVGYDMTLRFLCNKAVDYCMDLHGVEFKEIVGIIVDKSIEHEENKAKETKELNKKKE